MTSPEPLLTYALDAKPVHESIRLALMQLSGFALMQSMNGKSAVIEYAPVEAARDAVAAARDGLRGLRVPQAAAHHRHHLDRAVSALEAALKAAFAVRDPGSDDALLLALEGAGKHLRATSKILPGFEVVDFTQSCCAMHARLAAPRRI